MSKPRAAGPVLILALALTGGCSGAHGGDHHHGRDWEDGGHSYDRARRAAERGEILSLAEIYARAAARFPGRVLEAELELEHTHGGEGPGDKHWVYELKVLESGGRLRKVYLDAHTGAILEHEEDD